VGHPTMQAYRLLEWGAGGQFADVPVPQPGPNDVLVKMAAVGLCHSDIGLQDAPPGSWPFEAGFTLGHENAGWIASCGSEVENLAPGTPVLVSCVRSCGTCAHCLRGEDNYCWWSTRVFPRVGQKYEPGPLTRGVGLDGGLAEYMVAPAREVIALTHLTPQRAAVLSDAGGTSYHAVKQAVPKLRPESTAVVIGVGGLGGYAVQYLRLLTTATVVAVDISPERLEYARQLGAALTYHSDETVAPAVLDLSNGRGADAVFDFVGTDETLAMAAAMAAPVGRITVCGIAGGRFPAGWGTLPGGCEFVVSLGYTLAELQDIVSLGEAGHLRIETEDFALPDVAEAYQRLREGTLRSRALVLIDG
jgi:propanol-preferring alcohol dehydrogenase